MKLIWFLYISIIVIACNQAEESTEETSSPASQPTQPLVRKMDEVDLLLSKVKWSGIYDSKNKVFILGERHFQHDRSIAFIANLMFIFQKKGQKVVTYIEGMERGKTFTYNIQPGNSQLVCNGLEKKLREFDGDQNQRRQEESRAYRVIEGGDYTSPALAESVHAKNFVSELIHQGIDTSVLKKHLRMIIYPLDNDIKEIIQNAKPDEITIILCGVLHSVNMQRETTGVNIIRFLYGGPLDDSTAKRSVMYRYLSQ